MLLLVWVPKELQVIFSKLISIKETKLSFLTLNSLFIPDRLISLSPMLKLSVSPFNNKETIGLSIFNFSNKLLIIKPI